MVKDEIEQYNQIEFTTQTVYKQQSNKNKQCKQIKFSGRFTYSMFKDKLSPTSSINIALCI
jgi:hypothetical protein